jgi:hypothetical protein
MHTVATRCIQTSVADAYTDQNTDQMVSQDTFGSQQELQFQFPSFVMEDAQQVDQVAEQPPKLQLQLDGS